VWLENGRIPIDLPAGSFDKLKLLQTQRAPGTRYRHLPSAICHPSGLDSPLLSSMGLTVRLCSQSAHHGGPAAR
jgi:hypothetical protein